MTGWKMVYVISRREIRGVRHDWWKKGLCNKRDQTILGMSGWKRVYVISIREIRHDCWEKNLCHKQRRGQIIKDVIGGKMVSIISRRQIRR